MCIRDSLDTGCEVSVIGRRLLPRDVALMPPKSNLFAANRTKIPLMGYMDMNFTVNGTPFTATLAVTNMVEELILGIDFLAANAAHWDFGNGRLLLGGRWVSLHQRVTADRVRRIYSAESVKTSTSSNVVVYWFIHREIA